MTEQQRKTIEAVRNAHARRADANRVGRGHAAIVVALDAALAPQSPAAPVPVEAVLTPKDLRRAVELAGEDHAKGVGDFLHHYHPGALVRVSDLVALLNDVQGLVRAEVQRADEDRDEEWGAATDSGDPQDAAKKIARLENERDALRSELGDAYARLAAYEEG